VLQVFYMDVAYVLQMVFRCFFQVFHMHVLSVSYVFRHMLQVLYLNVLKVDRVLHLSPHFLLSRLSVSSSRR